MENLKRNVTKYSGLPLSAVIYLVSTSAPVNELLKREVWKELFYRYFMEGRTFNVYDLLKGNPKMFANTIGWELQNENVAIPVGHAEAFIRDLIEFTEYIDRKVLESGVQFEWQLHELQGMKDMIERVRDAKIKDANTRQKINLFIDKINNARQNSLLLIEQAKEQARTESTELAVIPEAKHELMKQELKRLSIPVSKMTIAQWKEAVRQFDTYYPQDQKALIRQGLRKGISFNDHNYLALIAFKMNLELKVPYNMTRLLFEGLRYLNMPTDLFGSDKAFFQAVKEWYFSAEGSTENGWHLYSERVLEAMDGEFAETELINRSLEKMKALYPLIKKVEGAKLSEVFQQTAKGWEQVNYTPTVTFNKEKNQWVTDEFSFQEREMTLIERFYTLFNYIRNVERLSYRKGVNMVTYGIEMSPKAEIQINKLVPYQYHAMIRDFCQFPSTLVIDESMAELAENPPTKLLGDYFDEYHDRNELKWWFKHKFNSRMVEKDELAFLFTTKEGLRFFKIYSNIYFGEDSGWLKTQGDYIGRYFDQVLSLFDFSKQEERVRFFQLPIKAERYFTGGGYLTPDHAQMVDSKLKKEAPHEYQIVAEYFGDINLNYEEFVVHPLFSYLSELERLLLEKDGIQTGETQQHQGYKEGNIHYTSSEARTKFVIEYFQHLYGGEL